MAVSWEQEHNSDTRQEKKLGSGPSTEAYTGREIDLTVSSSINLSIYCESIKQLVP